MKKIIKYNLAIVMMIILILGIFNIKSYAESEFKINIGESTGIQVSNIHYDNAKWIIANTNIARIKNTGASGMIIGSWINYSYSANIEGIKKGTTEVMLVVNDKILARANIVVTDNIKSIEFEKESIEIGNGKEYTLNPIFNTETPDDIDTLKWTSSNEEVATVDEKGKVLARNVGSSTITVGNDNCSASIEVKVVIKLENIEMDKTFIELEKGKSDKINIKYFPNNTTESKEVQWTSDDENIAIVDNFGNITAIGNGETTVTAKVGEHVKKCKIHVISPLREIEFKNKEQYGQINSTLNAQEVIYNPIDTTDSKDIQWSSKDENVATIDENGIITCKNEGDTEIIATVGKYTCKYNLKVRQYKLGDVDQNGEIDAQDAVMILKYVAHNITLNEQQLLAANTTKDKDGMVDAQDAVQILKYVAHNISEF